MADYKYSKAYKNARDKVKEAIEEFRNLSKEEKQDIPLLYWLLGTGTPAYKMSKVDAAYQSKPRGHQKCGNCEFAYKKLANDKFICSWMRGKIELDGWCRLWVKAQNNE